MISMLEINCILEKYPTTPLSIIYKTETHIVMLLEGTTEPICWKQTTLLLNGPTKEPRAPKVEKVVEVEETEKIGQAKILETGGVIPLVSM